MAPGRAPGRTRHRLLVVVCLLAGGFMARAQQTPAQPPPPQAPAGGAPAAPADDTTAMPLVPATPSASKVIGVVAQPELALLLQKAGYDARLVTPEQVDMGALDPYGLLLVCLERPLTVTGAAFLRDFVGRGGALIGCSWGAAIAPRRQAAFPVYRLQEPLQIRVTGWSADGNAYLRAVNNTPLFRGLPPFLDVDYRATPLVEAAPGGRVDAVWVSEDPAGGTQDARSPAIVVAGRCVYFAPNVLSAALRSRQMLRLLANAIGTLLPAAGADPGRLPLAELEVALAEAKRVAASCSDPDAPTLLAAAEAQAAAAVQLAAQTPAAPVAPAAPDRAAAPAATAQPVAAGDAGSPAPPGGALETAPAAAAAPGGLDPGQATALPPLPEATLAAIQRALDAAERVALLRFPCRPTEVRGVLLPRSALPPSKAAIVQLLDRLRAAGVNLVLPEVYSAGLTLAPGPSQDPRFRGYDPLASLLAEAPPRGIAVYAWVSVLSGGPTGAKAGVLAAQPARAALARNGSRLVAGGSLWLCPSQPESREAVCAGIRSAVSDPRIQGVVLDGVDFAGATDACYCRTCVSLFRADTGRNPQSEALRGEWEQEWLRWRRDRVGTLVRRIQRELRLQRPGRRLYLALSERAADPRSNSLADWRAWVPAGGFQAVCVEMNTAQPALAQKLAARVRRLAPDAAVIPVVDASRVRTARHAMGLITALQEAGAVGLVFGSPVPVAGWWAADLARGSFRRAAALP